MNGKSLTSGLTKTVLVLLMLVVFTVFTACDFGSAADDSGGDNGGDEDTNFFPPADEIAQVQNGIPIEGFIESEDEEDWHKFSAYAGQIVKIDLQQHVSPVDPQAYLYESGNTSQLSYVEDRDGSDAPTDITTGNIILPLDGDYYVRVTDRYGDDTSSTVPYVLTISVMDNPDSGEPANDEKINATALSNGISVSGYIATQGDVDWYKINAYSGQIIQISLNMPPNSDGVDPLVNLKSQYSDSTVWYSYDYDGSDGPSEVISPNILISTDDVYCISVQDRYDNEFSTNISYTLTVNIINNPDSNEPDNDEKGNASAISNGIPVSGYIATENDVDWYKINVYSGHIIQIELTMPPNSDGVDPLVNLKSQYSDSTIWYSYDHDGSDGPSEVISPNILISTDDVYCISVQDRYDNEFSINTTYTLTVNIMNNPDSNEPANNEKANAVTISNGISVSGFIATENDIDWYKINAYSGQTIQISLTMPVNSDGVDPLINLKSQYSDSTIWYSYDYDGSDGPSEVISPNILISADDVYCISVQDRYDNEFSITVPYTLTVTVN